MRRVFLASLLVAVSTAMFGQGGSAYPDIVVINNGTTLVAAPFAGVQVCTSSATGTPCSPKAIIYTDTTLSVQAPNPFNADANGNYTVYAAPGTYKIQTSTAGQSTNTKLVTIAPDVNAPVTFSALVTFTGGVAGIPTSGGVNNQTGTIYTVLSSDQGKLVSFSNANPIAVTLPTAGGPFGVSWFAFFQNRGPGAVTITSASLIDGGGSVGLQQNQGLAIYCNGTTYYSFRGLGPGGVNVQAGTTYNVTAADNDKLIVFTNANPVAVSVPQAGTSFISTTFKADFAVVGAGLVTITPTVSKVDNNPTTVLSSGQGLRMYSDGSNYWTNRGGGGGGGGGSPFQGPSPWADITNPTYGASTSLTNNTAAIQAAIDACAVNNAASTGFGERAGCPVFVPPAKNCFSFSSPILIQRDQGDGRDGSFVDFYGVGATSCLKYTGSGSPLRVWGGASNPYLDHAVHHVKIHGLMIDMSAATGGDCVFDIKEAFDVEIYNTFVGKGPKDVACGSRTNTLFDISIHDNYWNQYLGFGWNIGKNGTQANRVSIIRNYSPGKNYVSATDGKVDNNLVGYIQNDNSLTLGMDDNHYEVPTGPTTATAHVTISGGGAVNACVVDTAGAGYYYPPTADLSGGGGTGASISFTISGNANVAGVVTGCSVDAGGAGYATPPVVTVRNGSMLLITNSNSTHANGSRFVVNGTPTDSHVRVISTTGSSSLDIDSSSMACSGGLGSGKVILDGTGIIDGAIGRFADPTGNCTGSGTFTNAPNNVWKVWNQINHNPDLNVSSLNLYRFGFGLVSQFRRINDDAFGSDVDITCIGTTNASNPHVCRLFPDIVTGDVYLNSYRTGTYGNDFNVHGVTSYFTQKAFFRNTIEVGTAANPNVVNTNMTFSPGVITFTTAATAAIAPYVGSVGTLALTCDGGSPALGYAGNQTLLAVIDATHYQTTRSIYSSGTCGALNPGNFTVNVSTNTAVFHTPIHYDGVAIINLPGTPSRGDQTYCTDCKRIADGAAAGSVAVGAGSGTMVTFDGTNWRIMF